MLIKCCSYLQSYTPIHLTHKASATFMISISLPQSVSCFHSCPTNSECQGGQNNVNSQALVKCPPWRWMRESLSHPKHLGFELGRIDLQDKSGCCFYQKEGVFRKRKRMSTILIRLENSSRIFLSHAFVPAPFDGVIWRLFTLSFAQISSYICENPPYPYITLSLHQSQHDHWLYLPFMGDVYYTSCHLGHSPLCSVCRINDPLFKSSAPRRRTNG